MLQSPFNPVIHALQAPARGMAIIGGWWLLALSFATVAEILSRKLLGRSFQGVDEVGSYTTAVFSALALSWTLLSKSHTRVDFLLARMPAAMRALLNATAYATLAGLAVFGAWRGWFVLSESLEFQATANSPLGTPLWIPQSLWLAGMTAFALCASALATHALWLLLTDRRRLNALYGPMTLDEEIAAEAGAILARKP